MAGMVILPFSYFAQTVEAQQAVKISGSSTIRPILDRVAVFYDQPVETRGGGSGGGIKDAIAGISDIGAASRAITPQEQQQISYTTIGMDTLVFIVNQRNPLTETDQRQIRDLYVGRVGNWKEIGGHDQPVVLVSKEVGRATLDIFEDYSGLHSPKRTGSTVGDMIAPSAYEVGSNLEGVTLVGGIPGAIGYVSLGTALSLKEMGMPVKLLRLDGVDPTVANVINGTYPILRELNLVYRENNPRALNFIDTLMSRDGQEAVKAEGFIPVR